MSHPIIRSQDFAAQTFSVSGRFSPAERPTGERPSSSAGDKCQAGSSTEFFVLLLSIAAGADAGHAS